MEYVSPLNEVVQPLGKGHKVNFHGIAIINPMGFETKARIAFSKRIVVVPFEKRKIFSNKYPKILLPLCFDPFDFQITYTSKKIH